MLNCCSSLHVNSFVCTCAARLKLFEVCVIITLTKPNVRTISHSICVPLHAFHRILVFLFVALKRQLEFDAGAVGFLSH